MPEKTLQEKIAVMQAAADGAEIEVNKGVGWESVFSVQSLMWNWVDNDYRVAPKKPREFWLNVYQGGTYVVHKTQDSACGQALTSLVERIHVREVLPE